MRKYFFALILFTSSIYSQQIKVNVENIKGNKAMLYSLSGERTTFVDSIYSSNQGEFVYQPKNILHNGIYRFLFDINKWIDFIYDGKDIELITDANNVLDSLRVITSESNELFYSYIRLNKTYKTKTELLQLILARYPKDDEYYSQTQKRLVELQNEYKEFVNIDSQKEPNSFIAEYIHSAQLPVIDYEIQPQQQIDYLKTHALDYVDFNNSLLIDSDVFTNKAIEYLTYYRNPQLPKELLEKEFMKAVDTLLNKAKVNQLVYQHITEYLIDGFKKFGFDNVLDYIVDNYVIKDDICLDETLERALQKRIQQEKNFKIGNTVPNIVVQDTAGSIVKLSDIKNDKILILFYASWCPHCQNLVPKLYEYYSKQKEKNFEVLAMSIDSSRTDWINFIKTNNLNWLNVSDLKGWDSQAALDYCIYATPTMFLVDNHLKIIAKPMTIDDVKKIL